MKEKKTILLTFDYELFLKESGTIETCLINPCNILRGVLNKHKVKATFFVDILYYFKLLQKPGLNHHSEMFRNQIQHLLTDGHDIELHLHPQWLDAVYENNQWVFPDLKKYRLQQLTQKEIDELFKIGIKLLEDICKPFKPDYKVSSFRAGGLCITPFEPLKSSFIKYNIKIDSSVAKGLVANSQYQNYDFSNIPDLQNYWFGTDPLLKVDNRTFLEIPISVYSKSILDKLREKLLYRHYAYESQPFSQGEGKSLGPGSQTKLNAFNRILSKVRSYKMPFSLDYTYPELIINKIKKSDKKTINFISHIKFLSKSSLLTIEKLVQSRKYEFQTFNQYYNNSVLSAKKNLILITGHFPYDTYEGYLDEEILVLSRKFEKIIVISQDTKSDYVRPLPQNCKVFRLNTTISRKEIISNLLPALFSKEFFLEFITIMFTYRKVPNRRMMIDLLTTIIAGRKIYKYIDNLIDTERLNNNNLILYSYWYDKCAYAITRLLKRHKASLGISRAHSYDLYFWRNNINYLPLKKYILKNISSVYFISEHGRNYFKSILKISNADSEKLKISKLGTINRYALKEYKKKNDEFFLLSCSHIVRLKRIGKIIEALALINDISLKWVHIGEEYEWTKSNHLNEIKELAKNLLGNKNNIHYFFAGNYKYEDLMNYYHDNQIDLFINVSQTEGLPVSIMEAMSFGIPVIATSVGGTPEIVNNTNGILLSPNPSPGEIAETIRKIYNLSETEIVQYRNNSYKMWKENFDAEKNYENFVKEISNAF